MVNPVELDYLAIGHVTRDVIENGSRDSYSQPGGGAFYSALQASRLGLRAAILTKGVPEEIEALLGPYLEEIDLHVIPAAHTTTLSTRGQGASRRQRVLAWAGPISEQLELGASIVHFAPVAGEGPNASAPNALFVGITPQGQLRRWGDDGQIELAPLELAQLPPSFHAAVISECEQRFCEPLLAAAKDLGGPVIAVTAGPEPARLHLPGGSVMPTAASTVERVIDDLGAGDVFAAAFFVELADGTAALDASSFASAAAAVRIEGAGPAAIGTRDQIATRAERR